MVFTLSKNTLALFSSLFGTLKLKTLVDLPGADPAIIPGSTAGNFFLVAIEDVPASKSMMSGLLEEFCCRRLGVIESGGNAVI